MIKLDEGTLVAYVDGQLTDEDTHAVTAALANDPAARAIVEQLRRTPASLRSIFDATLHQPLPPTLAEYVLHSPIARRPIHQVRLLYATAAALVLFGVGLALGILFGASSERAPTVAVTEPWVAAVADYQVLYGRETLTQPDATPDDWRNTELRLGHQLGRDVRIPDFSAHGLAFKRGQLLEFDGQPLIQLAYLPHTGKPIAYCIIATPQSDSPPTAGNAHGLSYVHWRRGGLAFVVIGEAEENRLRALVDAALHAL